MITGLYGKRRILRHKILREIPALKVQQWLADWEEVKWSADEHRAKPRECFYQFSISANDLKALSGIYPRTTEDRKRGTEDLGIERRHDAKRSDEIARFVKYGFPWSELSEAKRESGDFRDLRKPGWLPTAIVVNILQENDVRQGKEIAKEDLIKIRDGENGLATIYLPEGFTGRGWEYTTLPPIEVIDGQHRLWAFGKSELDGEFQLPVVAFVGLDISWQAYLFYTINIKPKKINASLAYDLYPLLRTEDWLEKFEGHVIYRETRAQELVDSLREVQELTGHRSYETTLQYAHLSEEHVKKQVNRLPFADGYGKNKAKMQVYGNLTRKNPVTGKVIKLNTGAG